MTALGGRERLRDGSGWRGSLGLGLGVLVLLAGVAFAAHAPLHGSLPHDRTAPQTRTTRTYGYPPPPPGRGARPLHVPTWLLILGAVVLGGGLLLALAALLRVPVLALGARRHLVARGGGEDLGADPDATREALRDAVTRSLEELRRDPNARRAIIGVYRLMETSLARAGVPREPAEAPVEYLTRTLDSLQVGPVAPRRLTALFERARFDDDELDLGLRDEAIDCLLRLREAL